MEKKQGKINTQKLVKTVFWAAILVLVLFFGKKLLPGEEAERERGNQNDVSGNDGALGYRENDGDEVQRSVTVVTYGGQQYVETSASGRTAARRSPPEASPKKNWKNTMHGFWETTGRRYSI